MKVIITGATGFVGGALVKHCMTDNSITSAIVLSRRPLDKSIEDHPKIKVIIRKDFTQWPTELLKELQGAEACLWAIGGRVDQFSSVEEMHRAQHDTTLAAAKAFATSLAPHLTSGTKFRFVFCSGRFTVWDQDAKLWFMSDSRKSKGFVEKGLHDIAEADKEVFEVYSVRPGGIISGGTGAVHAMKAKIVFGIGVDTLATAMCGIAANGYERQTVENDELLKLGQ